MIKQIINLGQGIIDLYGDLVQGEIVNAHSYFAIFFLHKQNQGSIKQFIWPNVTFFHCVIYLIKKI
jgi:hypothetical protein